MTLPHVRFAIVLTIALSVALPIASRAAPLTTAPPAGQAAPALQWTDLDGRPATLAQWPGRPVLPNNWASWCGPCRREMPVLARAQQGHPDIRFLFVNQGETRDEVDAFMAAERLSLRNVLLDKDAITAEHLQVHAYPTTLFFNGQGRLQHLHLGELTAAGLQSKLDDL